MYTELEQDKLLLGKPQKKGSFASCPTNKRGGGCSKENKLFLKL